MRALSIVLLAALGGCMRDALPPDPGKCAEAPPGKSVWTWGEIRIGTCLSGPADVGFFQQDGKTWLAVSNANPYLDFDSGSFLVVDWDSVDLSRDLNLMHEVAAGAKPFDDFVGGFGVVDWRRQALVTGRKSPKAGTRVADDRVYIVDLDDPLRPVSHKALPKMPMRDDPFPVVVDRAAGRAYIGNLTDHSVAVFDLNGEEIERIDVAPRTTIDTEDLVDADNSGSMATLASIEVVLPEQLPDDAWELTWVEGSARLWVPEPAGDDGLDGLQRFTDVGVGPVEDGIPVEIHPDEFDVVNEPSFALLEAAWMYFVDETGGTIWRVSSPDLDLDGFPGDGPIGDWSVDSADAELLGGGEGSWDAIIGGPAVEIVDDTVWLFYDGRVTGGPPALGFSVATGTDLYGNAPAPFLDPAENDGFAGFESPTAWHDVSHDGVRVWTAATLDDGRRVIALTETRDNGATWSAPEVVLSDVAADLVQPVVKHRGGRFQLWYTRDDGTAWSHRTAWSWDGRTWYDDTLVMDSALPWSADRDAPRLAVQTQDIRAWSGEGRDSGPIDSLITAGTTFVDLDSGFSINVASGYEVDNAIVPDGRAEVGLYPGSYTEIGGVPTLYVTLIDDARSRLGVLQQFAGSWLAVRTDLIPANEGGNKAGVSDPVVLQHAGGFTLWYAATDGLGITRIRRATSTNGLDWTPVDGPALVHDDDWDGAEQRPHSVRETDGGVRLWYSGSNGSRLRIGSARASSPDGRLAAETGLFDPWRFEPGLPGSFDDGGVGTPMVWVDDDGVVHMLYSGFDGAVWSLGHAVMNDDGTFTRRLDPVSDRSLPSMTGEARSFSSAGATHPVLVGRDGEDLELVYAGTDGFVGRMGRAVGRPERQWPAIRFPTVGDTLNFTTELGRTGTSVIELAQDTQTFQSTGIGMSSMTLDPDRGFLYVTSKLEGYFYVIDLRDDSGAALNDANALDLEGVVALASYGGIGFRDAVVDRARDRLYLSTRNPDGVAVIDLTRLVDDDTKDVTWFTAAAVLPLEGQIDDAGADTVGAIGGAGMTLSGDGRYLVVAHHRGNSVAIYDLEQGPWGSEVAWLADIGENPHAVTLSPDGRYAVVANYVGQLLDERGGPTSSTLAVIDLDPSSDSFLEVVTWLANR